MPKPKKKTNAQPAEEKTNPGSKFGNLDKMPPETEAELITSEPQQPKPEPPLTLEALAARQAKFKQDLVSDINELVKRLTPALQLADQLEQAKQQTEQNQQNVQGPQAPQQLKMPAWLEQVIGQSLKGDNSNPLQEKMNKAMGMLLDKTIENIQSPPKSSVEKYLEEYNAKKLAKSISDAID